MALSEMASAEALPPSPKQSVAAESFADDLTGARSEYMEHFAPRSFVASALPSKTAFEESLTLPWGERCMLERAARGIVDPDCLAQEDLKVMRI